MTKLRHSQTIPARTLDFPSLHRRDFPPPVSPADIHILQRAAEPE